MDEIGLSCPLPISQYKTITLAHGGGGRLMHEAIDKIFSHLYTNKEHLDSDGAQLNCEAKQIVLSTDSFVISPLFFPGGDIGSLAVFGTTNDVAMAGAEIKSLTVSFILEEGFEIEQLWRIVLSMKQAADRVGAEIVTGDTKVVEKGCGDGVYINVTGLGYQCFAQPPHPSRIKADDRVLVSGDVGRHAAAILAEREHFQTQSNLQSDAAPLVDAVKALARYKLDVHCMRDITRGGLVTVLNEVVEKANLGIRLKEEAIPIHKEVAAMGELFGINPLYSACEGACVLIVPVHEVNAVIDLLQTIETTQQVKEIGQVVADRPGRVTMINEYGIERILDTLSAEQMPRIC